MTRKKGKAGDLSPTRSPNAAGLPAWLDPDGSHGKLWIMVMKPAVEGVTLPSNPFTIAKSIQATVGTISEAYRDKEQNLVLKVRGEAKVKKLERMTELIDGTKVTVTEHPRLNLIKVVVTCHSVSSMSDEELKAEQSLQEQGVVDVRRFRKGGPTMTMTIRGTVAPEAIFFGYDRCRTKLYVQAPLQCFRCFEFGHPKVRCSAEEVCRNCSEVHPIAKDNEGKTICEKPARCRHCQGPHSPTSRVCPLYKQEEEIEKIRSTGKSPREARRIFEEQQRQKEDSYATVASTSVQARLVAAQNGNNNEEILKELAKTQKELKRALEELMALKAAAANEKEEKRQQQTKPQEKKNNKPTTQATGNDSDMETDEDETGSVSSQTQKRRISESSEASSSSASTIVDSEEEKEKLKEKTKKPIPIPKNTNTAPTKPPGKGKQTNNKKDNNKRSKQ